MLEAHDCVARVAEERKVRRDLFMEPLDEPDWDLFTDGSSRRDDTGVRASYAVVQRQGRAFRTLEADEIPQPASAQLAEVYGLLRALELSEGLRVNIYTDSNYAWGAVHIEGAAWIRRGFRTAAGTPVKHDRPLRRLLRAVRLPTQVTVIKVVGHSSSNTPEARGNDAADRAAKAAIQMPTLRSGRDTSDCEPPGSPRPEPVQPESRGLQVALLLQADAMLHLIELQGAASAAERREWINKGAARQHFTVGDTDHHIWRSEGGEIVAPRALLPSLFKEIHGPTHIGIAKVIKLIKNHWWAPKLKEHMENLRAECKICNKHNARRPLPHPMLKFPNPTGPWQEICMDFTDMGARLRTPKNHRYLLVIVDRFSRWVEAFPTRAEDGETVVNVLTQELIPRYGVPTKICTDNGTHFKNEHLARVEGVLGITHRFGSVYHPESQGLVERANRTIKDKIAKVMAGTQLTWVEALPLALMSMRQEKNGETFLTPHEILMGHSMPGPRTSPQWEENWETMNQDMTQYMRVPGQMVRLIAKQVRNAHPEDAAPELPLKIGDEVYLRQPGRSSWSEQRWHGPYPVTEISNNTLKVGREGDNNWHHFSHCSRTKKGRPIDPGSDIEEEEAEEDDAIENPDMGRSDAPRTSATVAEESLPLPDHWAPLPGRLLHLSSAVTSKGDRSNAGRWH
ncbi:protein NYNRIN-like [Hemitrygon akajei]|uniref:protein NYNRIN-like n=1 Tax=Hemitrygon akajei TaxID=2704970 RepID=UPI003BFA067B